MEPSSCFQRLFRSASLKQVVIKRATYLLMTGLCRHTLFFSVILLKLCDNYLLRGVVGLLMANMVIPGCDMAGVVIGRGSDVTKFRIGDEVYGNIQDFNAEGQLKQLGTLAEFIVVEERLVAEKPKNLSFEEAASLPLAVQTAMEGFMTAYFKEGHNIFVVGGAGGVGSLVVQLAKYIYGASYVVATTSTPKVEFVRTLGADKVVDYTKIRYEEIEEKYDFVYDTIGDSKNSFVVAKEKAPIIDITWPLSNPEAVYSGLTVSGEILEKLRPYLEIGKLKAVIDPTGPYNFMDVIEAFRYLETGRARGKVVISSFPSQQHHHHPCPHPS